MSDERTNVMASATVYRYHIAPSWQGHGSKSGFNATMHKIIDGDDDTGKHATIGHFKSETEAKEACRKHFAKASSFLAKMGKPVPECLPI
jgi:hypothetical protein